MTRSFRTAIEGDDAVLLIPLADIHSIRTALRPVMAGDVTSNNTQRIRDALDKALALVQEKGKQHGK